MIISLPNVLKAYYSCRKGKRNSTYAQKFEKDFENKIYDLHVSLKDKTYVIQKSICFIITYPTTREIFAASFEDRVVHHMVINHIEDETDKTFIYDSYACRKNKGTTLGLKRLKKFIKQSTQNYTQPTYYLKLDINSFFYSIDKNILKKILKNKIYKSNITEKEDTLWICNKIIDHNPCTNYIQKGSLDLIKTLPSNKSLFTTPNTKGLPIGNLTSQFFANLYLNELDQYIKRVLKIKYYLRYADDILILSDNMDQLNTWELQIEEFLNTNLNLNLKHNKTKYGSVYQGIDFIGYIVKPNYILCRNRVVNNLKKKLYYFNNGFIINRSMCMEEAVPIDNPISIEDINNICSSINSTFGHLKWSNSYNLRQSIYENHFGILKDYLDIQGQLESFRPHIPTS